MEPLAIIPPIVAAITFLWNIADRARKQGEQSAQINLLIVEMKELRSEVNSMRNEIAVLKERIREQDEELKDLRKALREVGRI